MPIRATSCPPDTTPDVCCDTLFLIGDRIRTVACDAVMCCTDESCDQPYRSYTTFGPRIQDVIGDSIIITMTNATTATTSSTDRGRVSPLVVTRASFRLELRENGWPQAKANQQKGVIVAPDGAEQNAAAAHSMAHAEKMWRALVNAAAIRNGSTRLFPLPTNHHVLQGAISVGPLTPVGPQATQATWSVELSVDTLLI